MRTTFVGDLMKGQSCSCRLIIIGFGGEVKLDYSKLIGNSTDIEMADSKIIRGAGFTKDAYE